jgi:hypothetical protein
MADLPETEEKLIWINACNNSAGCVEAIAEKVNNRVGPVTMANFEIKFYQEEHATELVNYNNKINAVMPVAKENSWCEIHPFYPDQTADARAVRVYSDKLNKNNNKNNNKPGSGRGNNKIEGSWKNPFSNNNHDMQFPPLGSKGGKTRYTGADIIFSKEESI